VLVTWRLRKKEQFGLVVGVLPDKYILVKPLVLMQSNVQQMM